MQLNKRYSDCRDLLFSKRLYISYLQSCFIVNTVPSSHPSLCISRVLMYIRSCNRAWRRVLLHNMYYLWLSTDCDCVHVMHVCFYGTRDEKLVLLYEWKWRPKLSHLDSFFLFSSQNCGAPWILCWSLNAKGNIRKCGANYTRSIVLRFSYITLICICTNKTEIAERFEPASL